LVHNAVDIKRVIIRVDISERIGGGHFMRMIGLGQFLFDNGYEIHFACIPYQVDVIKSLLDSSFILHLISDKKENTEQSDLEGLLTLADELQPNWIILDGYHFTVGYEQGLKSKGFRLVRVDDLPRQRCVADVLINQNHGSEFFDHEISSSTIKLAGLRYLLLRREFRQIDIDHKKPEKKGSLKLLVCLGAGSAIIDGINTKIVKAISELEGVFSRATIILGKMGVLTDEILELKRTASFDINIIKYHPYISTEMLEADVAITAGGYSMWELLYLKTPYIVISLNDAQDKYTRFLASEGLCDALGMYESITHESIKSALESFVENEAYRKEILLKSEVLLDRNNNGKKILQILANKYNFNS